MEFITGISDVTEAIQSLFVGDVQAVLYTQGAKGAELYTKEGRYKSSGFKVTVADTTGAGDAFMGGFFYKLLEKGCSSDKPGSVTKCASQGNF
ncbi:hypothetical protein GCM10020331_098290 [Ectobacillus funiculus]